MKLTCLINISTKPYKGGAFHIFNSGPYIVNEFTQAGDVLVFRSYLNHMVMPVESGERKTLALFMEGPLMR
jgi:predicted 2-oxoglutarate/Fe(II)-dependent dioxygenase YbiX